MMFKRNILRLMKDTKINIIHPKENWMPLNFISSKNKTKSQLICHINQFPSEGI